MGNAVDVDGGRGMVVIAHPPALPSVGTFQTDAFRWRGSGGGVVGVVGLDGVVVGDDDTRC